jgi:RNA polymerase sigma-70 factor (ECF subfamily)
MMDRGASSRVIVVASDVQASSGGDGTRATVDFRHIFEEEFDYIWNTLRRMGVRPRDLEDVTHDVLLDVHRRLAQYDPSRPLRPWLFAFGFREASDYRRRARYRREVLDDDEKIDSAPLADERLEASESRALVRTALETLDLDHRAVFILHDLDDCPVPEIAATLQIPLNTAYSRLRVARERFKKAATRLKLRQGGP